MRGKQLRYRILKCMPATFLNAIFTPGTPPELWILVWSLACFQGGSDPAQECAGYKARHTRLGRARESRRIIYLLNPLISALVELVQLCTE